MHNECMATENVTPPHTFDANLCQMLSNVCRLLSVPDSKCSHRLDNSDTGMLRKVTGVPAMLKEWVSETFSTNLCAHKSPMQLPMVLPRLPRLWI